MKLEIKIWKEKNRIRIRNKQFHINTFGKNTKKAISTFEEALLLNLEDKKIGKS